MEGRGVPPPTGPLLHLIAGREPHPIPAQLSLPLSLSGRSIEGRCLELTNEHLAEMAPQSAEKVGEEPGWARKHEMVVERARGPTPPPNDGYALRKECKAVLRPLRP